MNPTSSADKSTSGYADQAADSADTAIRSARETAHDAFDGLSNTVANVKDQATATFERMRPQLDSMVSYAKEEPTKAVLIAAAAGAGLMAVVAMMGRSGNSARMPSSKELRRAANAGDDWRKAASEKVDNWLQTLSDAADNASSRADDAKKTTKNAAQTP